MEYGSENLTRKRVRVINRDVAVFAFFLFLSFIFWYLNSLGKETEAGINISCKIYKPAKRTSDKSMKNNQAELNLFLKGPGYSILKLKISGKKAPVNN